MIIRFSAENIWDKTILSFHMRNNKHYNSRVWKAFVCSLAPSISVEYRLDDIIHPILESM